MGLFKVKKLPIDYITEFEKEVTAIEFLELRKKGLENEIHIQMKNIFEKK